MQLFNSKPDDNGRSDKEMRVYSLLEQLNISFERVDHKPADTMEKCLEIEKSLGVQICKNLFLCNRQKTQFYLLLMPGDKPFKTKELSAQINSARLSFGEAEYMEKYLDILPGSVSILGLMNDKNNNVKLLIDEDLLNDEFIGCHPCINTSTLKLNLKDILSIYLNYVNHDYSTVNLKGY